jgi:hypothetical protein
MVVAFGIGRAFRLPIERRELPIGHFKLVDPVWLVEAQFYSRALVI